MEALSAVAFHRNFRGVENEVSKALDKKEETRQVASLPGKA